MIRKLIVFIVLIAMAFLAIPSSSLSATRLPVPANNTQHQNSANDTLRALDKLHSIGYRWTTNVGATKVIRAWQKANGLVVDGVVGPQTLASLGLDRPAAASGKTAPAPGVAAPAAAPVPAADVESIIREVWPDDLENEALRIAKRESSFVPSVYNHICCWGLFQIHWRAHRAWLAQFGVTNPEQLLDARTNAEMAYQLYLIDGWVPWTVG